MKSLWDKKELEKEINIAYKEDVEILELSTDPEAYKKVKVTLSFDFNKYFIDTIELTFEGNTLEEVMKQADKQLTRKEKWL